MKFPISLKQHPVCRWIYQNRYYITAFVLPVVIMTIAYWLLDVFPFGERQVEIIDSFHQYVPFFAEFRRKLLNGESLFYSFTGGLGMNFWAITAYYLASPLNLILLVLPQKYLLEGFASILVIKIALSSLTFSIYICRHTHRYDISILWFSLFYALCGWTLGYNWNIMWLDCLVFLPLILLGLERLMHEGKGILYALMLAGCIITNYYISIMVCIFLVLYFFVAFMELEHRSLKLFFIRGLQFAGYSLLAGGTGMVLILPAISALSVSNSADSTFPTGIEFYHSFAELLSQQFAFVTPTDVSGSPNLYFGVLTLLLVILYLFAKHIPLRVRLLKTCLLVFLLLSTNVKILAFIWHGLHFPNSLPARFTFIYAFLALTMAYDAIREIRSYHYYQYFLAFAALMCLTLYCWTENPADLEDFVFIITDLFLFIYFIWMCLSKTSIRLQKYLPAVLLILVTVEAGGNAIYGLYQNGSINRTQYLQYVDSSAELKALAEELEDGNFYRMELDTFNGRNNNMWLNLPGISLFASTMNAGLNDLMDQIGYFSATNKYSYEGATPLTDSIFGVKYLVATKQTDSIRTFEYLSTSGKQSLYVNSYALSVAFLVDEDYANWDTSSNRPQDVLNDYVYTTTGITDLMFEDAEITGLTGDGCTLTANGSGSYTYSKSSSSDDASITFTLDIEEGESYYIYYEASTCSKLVVTRNGTSQSYSDTRGHIVELADSGTVTVELVTDSSHQSGTIKLYLFTYNEEVFEAFYADVSANQLEVQSYSSVKITGQITADEDGILFTSIPWDSGWTVKVDGQKVETYACADALLYIYLSEGEHTIEFTYLPTGFIPGFLITAACCLILVILFCRGRRKEVHAMHDKLTETDIKRLQDEIDYRKQIVRRDAIDAVKEAREQGDLSENFEYYAAKKEKNRNESRIRYLERMIRTAEVISEDSAEDEIGMNDTVTLFFEEEDETESYKIVTTIRENSLEGRISNESPIGKAILGHKKGDRVYIQVNEKNGYYVVIQNIEKTTDDGTDTIRSF